MSFLAWVLVLFVSVFTPFVIGATDRPIIAILTLPSHSSDDPGSTSQFPASYVKYLESGGARVAPLLFDWPDHLFDSILQQSNGVLITGGNSSLARDLSHPFFLRIQRILNHSSSRFLAGDIFPIWGTCLGFELLINALNQAQNALSTADAEDLACSVSFTSSAAWSRFFAPDRLQNHRIFKLMRDFPLTYHHHRNMLAWSDYQTNALLQHHLVALGTARDLQNISFVTLYEGRVLPIFGSQYHPEKPSFEWDPLVAIPHQSSARDVSQYHANRFIDLARTSSQRFPDPQSESLALIYNYLPTSYPSWNAYYVQIYYFSPARSPFGPAPDHIPSPASATTATGHGGSFS